NVLSGSAALHLEREAAAGRADVEHPFANKGVSVEILVKAVPQIPRTELKTQAWEIDRVVETTVPDRRNRDRRINKHGSVPAFLTRPPLASQAAPLLAEPTGKSI